ncbi:MAG: TonB-dependent receptor [Flavobacteriaceae bacterium]|nr:TonB-dependent receptor [Flavobacteriaceae bacterium]
MRIIINILFLGFCTLIYGQNTLSGTITDHNNQPIPGADIYIENLNLGTNTNENGYYELTGIPRGKHTITWSLIGFETQNLIIEFTSNDSIDQNISFEESFFHMDEVIVSTPFNKTQSENVMKVTRKSMTSLKKQGSPTLVQSLTAIPGVDNFSTGNGIGKPVIRGLKGNRVLVYTQGIRLENQQWGGEHGLGINEASIESVEVIKGPASLLYGSDALGGVLFLIPERFANDNETNVLFSQEFYSNTLGSNSSLGVKTSIKNLKFLARGSYSSNTDYKIPDGNRVSNSRFTEKDFNTGIALNKTSFSSTLRYNYNHSKIGITEEGIAYQSTDRTPEFPYQELDNHILSLQNNFFLNGSKLNVNLGYTYNNRKEFEEAHDDHEEAHDDHEEAHSDHEAAINLKLKTFTYEAKYYFDKKGKFETIAGIQGLFQNNQNFGEEILIPDADIKDFGTYLTSLFTINESSSLQGGLRYDYRKIDTKKHLIFHEHDGELEAITFEPLHLNFHSFNASLGLKTFLFDKINTRINIASGFRAPNLAELTSNGVHHGTNRYEIGNPNLNNEQNIQTDIALEYQNKHLEVYINGFYNKIYDYIYLNPTGEIEDEKEVFEYTQNDSKLYGGEFGFHLHPHPIHWLHLESYYQTVIGKQETGSYLPLIPANKISSTIRSEFDLNENLNEIYISLNMDYFFKQNKVGMFENESPDYSLLNFRVGSVMPFNNLKIKANFSINNLLNKNYISHLSALKADNIPNIGRNYVLGLNFEL